ncbi:DJ-1/PfpI family protein [Penicillium cataractarum]|uniref:DJ-1/PfpI family protein n=1 Tax=Penicillium cataractarum TaxID=2100454 RepID=A0A9W9R7W5_9EURO|nr:DJ-1/PfpI family protein [Penicillium cataractarum]KAJ5355267.1 DJ-1/PfpI family protein [Penicillium cataractarum]
MASVTEHLDIAPAGFFSCISRGFLKHAPPNLVCDDLISQALDFEHHWVTEDGKTPARLTGNLKVVPTNSFADCPPLDIIVLGAYAAGYQVSKTEKQFLRKAYAECAALLCVCAGFLPVLAAGILEGKTVTAPIPMLPMMRQTAPGTNWIKRRWAQDGKIWTSGSLLNGMDMVAAFGRHTWGGKGTLVDHMIQVGYWPERDVNYAEVTRTSKL